MKSQIENSEKLLLFGLQSGDMQSFEFLYQQYSPIIYSNMMKFLKDEHAADDLLQDLFLKIWENRSKIDPEQSFLAYLIIASRNMVFNFKRRLKLEIETAMRLSLDMLVAEDAIDQKLESKETLAFIDRIIDQLPTQRQKIFRLAKLEGLSYQEIASQLGISVSTVRDHIVKANKFIQNITAEDHIFLSFILTGLIFL